MSEGKTIQDGRVISHIMEPNGLCYVDDEWCIYCSDEIAPGMIYCTFCGYKFTAAQLAEVEDDERCPCCIAKLVSNKLLIGIKK